MRLTRHLTVAVVSAALALGTCAASADAKTIRVNWTDTQPWGGGRVVYHTSKIWISGDRFSVTVSITNRSKYQIRFFRSYSYDPAYPPRLGFGIAWHAHVQGGTIENNLLRGVAPEAFQPFIPRRLGVGKTLNLTFSGRTPLLRSHRTWWVTFGLVVPWQGTHALSVFAGPHGESWVSDKTFST